MAKWKIIGNFYDMTVEKKGKKKRIVDITGKVLQEFDI